MNNKELAIKTRKVIDELAKSEIGAYVDTGLRHKFYRQQMDGYLEFMKEYILPTQS